jgi:hypothetical protein
MRIEKKDKKKLKKPRRIGNPKIKKFFMWFFLWPFLWPVKLLELLFKKDYSVELFQNNDDFIDTHLDRRQRIATSGLNDKAIGDLITFDIECFGRNKKARISKKPPKNYEEIVCPEYVDERYDTKLLSQKRDSLRVQKEIMVLEYEIICNEQRTAVLIKQREAGQLAAAAPAQLPAGEVTPALPSASDPPTAAAPASAGPERMMLEVEKITPAAAAAMAATPAASEPDKPAAADAQVSGQMSFVADPAPTAAAPVANAAPESSPPAARKKEQKKPPDITGKIADLKKKDPK